MTDLPKTVFINEEGPREGFQIEKGSISTSQKIELIDSLSETGLRQIQVCSMVSPKLVPQWADAEAVARGFIRKPGVRYTALWLNDRGFERARAVGTLDMEGRISLTCSEAFLRRNQNRTQAENSAAQTDSVAKYLACGLSVEKVSLMAAFGCNFEGDILPGRVLEMVREALRIAEVAGVTIRVVSLADTMAWATPQRIHQTVGAVREAYPDLELGLHLHDTRGLGIANAFAGLQMGVAIFDASVAGLGGCPFAANTGAAGNVCTEDLVFMCEEMGIETGIDLDRLLESARLAQRVVGHDLPGSVKDGGTLRVLRKGSGSGSQSGRAS